MEIKDLIGKIRQNRKFDDLFNYFSDDKVKVRLSGVCSSFTPFLVDYFRDKGRESQLIVLDNKEDAAYFYNDLCAFGKENNVLFFPSSYTIKRNEFKLDATDVLLRTEVLSKLGSTNESYIVVTWPEAILERVLDKEGLKDNTFSLKVGDGLSIDFVSEILYDFSFERVDFVFEPGQFSVRGSIVDIFSFSNEFPLRLDFFGEKIESIRFFEIETQLSQEMLECVSIVPNIQQSSLGNRVSFLDFIGEDLLVWLSNGKLIESALANLYDNVKNYVIAEDSICCIDDFSSSSEIINSFDRFGIIEFGQVSLFESNNNVSFNILPQPSINKNFDLFADFLNDRSNKGGYNFILASNKLQIDRINAIYKDKGVDVSFESVNGAINEGFIDADMNFAVYTDHQIFDRYHKFVLKNSRLKNSIESLNIKELNSLSVGDYVVHMDHGIGRFGGLQKIDVNGSAQETIRIVYKDNDVLFVNIHSLHKISKYKGKDAEPPKIYKLGSNAWKNLTNKTKKKVKDIARELIQLYAKRKKEKAYSYSPDSYLQEELEASFIYEDTPDQYKATVAVKNDMESDSPMDRLVCGDVGFGKTEIAIRAAFKAVADSKQVAILVPTTILAFQHFKTFTQRLENMPCRIEYISRLRKSSEVKTVLADLKEGKVDIIIGTHKLIGKNVLFKDLGLLVVDEEQKFGVSVKEKLKKLKLNVDTLTLTATPIPRTLQFSLMGARDLSIMKTPPLNRYPIETEVTTFNEDVIREAIIYEISRNGQVFFIHNRVQNIYEMEAMINRLVPGIRTVVGHGQMEGSKLEKTMLGVMNGDYDVFIATTIIESGLDIPNANTIIINQAQNFGLSDLHQLRGRVGRSNKKAFCYLLAPSLDVLSTDARRRLKAIEAFSELGSGFNIAMQDLDIRGAGNLLGGEQSGFINDIGYESFQRILNEAMLELKESEFEELFYEEGKVKDDIRFVTDCQIDTDKEVLIPDVYVGNVSERIRLYRELDNIDTRDNLIKFKQKLIDRFGVLPETVNDLLLVVEIRWKAVSLGMERIIFKNNSLVLYFVSNQQSAFYNSDVFINVLKFVQIQVCPCAMREGNDKLTLRFNNVESVRGVYNILDKMKSL